MLWNAGQWRESGRPALRLLLFLFEFIKKYIYIFLGSSFAGAPTNFGDFLSEQNKYCFKKNNASFIPVENFKKKI